MRRVRNAEARRFPIGTCSSCRVPARATYPAVPRMMPACVACIETVGDIDRLGDDVAAGSAQTRPRRARTSCPRSGPPRGSPAAPSSYLRPSPTACRAAVSCRRCSLSRRVRPSRERAVGSPSIPCRASAGPPSIRPTPFCARVSQALGYGLCLSSCTGSDKH
jgi:hypothetical protein